MDKEKKKEIKVAIDPALEAAFPFTVLSRDTYSEDFAEFRAAAGKEFTKQIQSVQNDDLSQIEAMLYSQAITLQKIFTKYTAALAVAERFNQIQVLSQIALKAQNQSRATLATLVEMKRPNRTIFVRQQNNAFNQQVSCSKTELPEKNNGNELLSAEKNHEALDAGRKITSINIDKKLEAVEISRSKDNARQRD